MMTLQIKDRYSTLYTIELFLWQFLGRYMEPMVALIGRSRSVPHLSGEGEETY